MIDPLTLDQIRTFITVADCGSFRAGAARLSRVQSGVSTSIANLEAQLGVQLFDRSGHRPVLTPEGQTLLADSRDILLRVDTLRARARAFGEGVELALSIVVDTLFPIEAVGAALRETQAAYPAVALQVAVEPLGAPVQALLDQRCSLAIVVGEDFRDPRIAVQALGPVTQVAVAAASHPLAARGARAPLAMNDLADHVQVVLADPSPLSDGRDFGVLSPQTCRVNSQDTKHALIRAGVGWGRLPHWLVAAELRARTLVRLRTAALGRHSQSTSESYLARRLDQPFGPVARHLAGALAHRAPASGRLA